MGHENIKQFTRGVEEWLKRRQLNEELQSLKFLSGLALGLAAKQRPCVLPVNHHVNLE